MLNILVEGLEIPFLIDIGATLSTLDKQVVEQYHFPVSASTTHPAGLDGKTRNYPLTPPLLVQAMNRCCAISFSVTAGIHCCLAGRDLLQGLSIIISCANEGIAVEESPISHIMALQTGMLPQWWTIDLTPRTLFENMATPHVTLCYDPTGVNTEAEEYYTIWMN